MSFSWTSVTQGETKLQPAHFNEVQTNTNTLCSGLGIGNYSWSQLPVVANTLVEYEDLAELKSGLDYVHNNNVCIAHRSSHLSTVRSTPHYSTYNNNVDTGHRATHDSSYNNNVDTGHLTNNNSSYNNNVDTGYYASYHGAHRNAPHFSYHFNTHRVAPHYTAVQATQRASHMGNYRATPHNASYA